MGVGLDAQAKELGGRRWGEATGCERVRGKGACAVGSEACREAG